MFCPHCGNLNVRRFENNRPVADFYCPNCQSEYELKSKNGSISHKVPDGSYATMIERITSNQNPDFFFLRYSNADRAVKDLVFVPKYFFVPDIIEKRPPLSDKARRAGWTGCNILADKIPEQGRVTVIENGHTIDRVSVVNKVRKSSLLKTENLFSRGWLMDILNCVNRLSATFTLQDVYAYEKELSLKYTDNTHIREKIRQQLQILRDKGFIEFLGNGNYKKR
jgi:type II restriction enzyme